MEKHLAIVYSTFHPHIGAVCSWAIKGFHNSGPHMRVTRESPLVLHILVSEKPQAKNRRYAVQLRPATAKVGQEYGN